MELPHKDNYNEIVQKSETCLHTISTALKLMPSENPVQRRIAKEFCKSMVKNTNSEGEKYFEAFIKKITNYEKWNGELQNGDKEKYNSSVLHLLDNAVHSVNGKEKKQNPKTSICLPVPEAVGDIRTKNKPINDYIIDVYLDLASTVYRDRLDTNQKMEIQEYTQVLSEVKGSTK